MSIRNVRNFKWVELAAAINAICRAEKELLRFGGTENLFSSLKLAGDLLQAKTEELNVDPDKSFEQVRKSRVSAVYAAVTTENKKELRHAIGIFLADVHAQREFLEVCCEQNKIC